MALLANCHRDPKETPDAFQAIDFMPGEGKAEETPEEINAKLIEKMNMIMAAKPHLFEDTRNN